MIGTSSQSTSHFSRITSHRWRDHLLGAFAAGLLIVFFCLILLWHDPLVFWNDDYELSVLPVFADIARSWSEGHWPLLSPYSWVCGNLAGEFQYGTFSVFVNAAVILIWKFPLTFPQQAAALSITHLFVLGCGAFLLTRDRRFSIPLSIFVALVASLNGWIICWGATDWFGALGAFTWLPWAWWGAERAQDRQRTKWRFLWPTPFVYLLVTGGFPYTVLMLLLLIAWLSIKSLVQTRSVMSTLPMLLGVALGFGLSAPAWLAILDLVHGSARELQPASAHWEWIVPPAALPGLILPSWTVNWTDFSSHLVSHTATELACGLVAPVALIAGFIWRGRTVARQIKWELLLLVLVLLLSMLPTAGLFRWSFRWLPFFHLILALCAAETLQMLPATRLSLRWPGSATRATTALALIVLTAITMSILRTDGLYAFPLTWIFFALATLWYFLEFILRNSAFRGWTPTAITFLAFLATYLCIPPNGEVPKFNLSQELLKPWPLDPARLYLSIYPWAEQIYRIQAKPQPVGQILRLGSTSMWAGLRFINGYSPIRPAGVAREFHTAIHGEIDPAVGDYLLNYQAGPDGELAVSATISRVDDSRNRVQADIDVPTGDRPALLSFSRPYFRGYQARLGNQKLTVSSYRGVFPLVEVPANTHGQLILVYRPSWLIWGGSAAVACALAIMVGFCAAIYQRRYNIATEEPNFPV